MARKSGISGSDLEPEIVLRLPASLIRKLWALIVAGDLEPWKEMEFLVIVMVLLVDGTMDQPRVWVSENIGPKATTRSAKFIRGMVSICPTGPAWTPRSQGQSTLIYHAVWCRRRSQRTDLRIL
jgi:hypothetical protein